MIWERMVIQPSTFAMYIVQPLFVRSRQGDTRLSEI